MATRKSQPHSPTSAHLLLGADAYLRDEQRNAIIGENVPAEARDFAVARFSLERTPLSQILAHAETRPMLGERQVLVVSDADRLREEDLKPLQDYLAAPADFSVLVFEAEDLDRRTRAARFLLDNCRLHEVESDDLSRAIQKAQEFAREMRIELNSAMAEELVMALGSDLGRLRAELAKLRAYVGEGGRVTAEEVAALVVPAREFGIFELVGPLAEHRREEALLLLRRLLEKGTKFELLVGTLAWLYRQLLVARSLGQEVPFEKARQVLSGPPDRIVHLLRQAPRFAEEDLRAAFAALHEADKALRSLPSDNRAGIAAKHATLILETLVAKLAGGRQTVAPK